MRGFQMSRSLQSAVISAFLWLALPILAANQVAAAEVSVSFAEWTVPTKGSRPHDPLAAADGAIWYTGQMANKLGRVDPKTGQVREYALKLPHSGPHGLAEDKDGNIWFTGNTAGYIGKLDPRTGNVTEYKL